MMIWMLCSDSMQDASMQDWMHIKHRPETP
jgi:hypothetical protein